MERVSPPSNMTFRQLDLNKYLIVFSESDSNTPDLITWQLKQSKYAFAVSFVETRKVEGISGETIEMEIHLKSSMNDVADLIRAAAEESAEGWNRLERLFVQAVGGI
jgi:uncharacterized membrane protein